MNGEKDNSTNKDVPEIFIKHMMDLKEAIGELKGLVTIQSDRLGNIEKRTDKMGKDITEAIGMIKENSAKIDTISNRLIRMERTVDGNGGEGLSQRVAVLENAMTDPGGKGWFFKYFMEGVPPVMRVIAIILTSLAVIVLSLMSFIAK